ncbi:MAG: RpiR family transcriptional regulator, partial [Mesorhizobium sp.]
MTEAEGHVRLTSGDDPDGRDHVRRIPDIISLVKDSY